MRPGCIAMISSPFMTRRWRAAAPATARLQGLPLPQGLLFPPERRGSVRPARPCKAAWHAARRQEREPRRTGRRRGAPRNAPQRVLKWVGIAALGWILLSFLAFAVSAQLQSFKLSGEAKDALHGNPFLLLQRRRRSSSSAPTPARPTPRSRRRRLREVLRTAVATARRRTTPCYAGRIPRRHADADPGRRRHLPQTLDPPRQLRRDPRPGADRRSTPPSPSAAPRCRSRRSKQFLGIQIDHVAIVDFTGFEDLIDAVGGVEVDVPHKLCADISGGAGGGQGGVTLRLHKGENTLDGEKALAYSRGPRAERMPRPRQERLHASATTTSTARRPSRR